MSKGTAGREKQTRGAAASGIAKRGWARDVIRSITGRKRAEEALRESEGRYRDLVENINEVIYQTDADGRITYVSRAAQGVGAYSPSEVTGRLFTELLHPDDIQAFVENFREAASSGLSHPNEYRVLSKTGETLWFRTNGRPVFEGDQIVGFRGVLADITDRKRREEALRESEEHYRELTDSITDVFFAMDRDLRYTYWNKASENLTGISAEDAIGKSLYELFPEVKGTKADRLYHEVLRTRQPRSFVNEHRLGDRDFFFEISAYPSTTGLSVFVKDISERKRAKEALRQRTHDLSERVKELNCLYEVARLAEKPGNSLEEIVRGTVNLIPPAWQYPEVTCARVILEGREFTTENFRETVWRQACDVMVQGERIGTVEVCYLEERPESDEGPFLGEERNLINGIAQLLDEATERKRAEEALRESEDRFRSAFEHAATGMALVGLDGRLLQVNQVCCEQLGYSEEELTSTTREAVTHPDDVETDRDYVRRVLAGEIDYYQLEKRYVHKDGHVLWGHMTSSLLRDADDRPLYFISQIQDITERKRTEEALRESEKKYRDLVENINEVIYQTDASGRIAYVSPVIEGISGYSTSEVVGRPFAEFIHSDDLLTVQESFRKRLAGVQVATEYRVLLKSREVRWVSTSSQPIFEGDRVVGLRGVLTDTTERKRGEEALRESEKRYRELVEDINDIIFEVDAAGRLTYISPVATQASGYSPSEIIGRPFTDFVHPDDLTTLQQDFRDALSGHPAPSEYRMLSKSREPIWFRSSDRPIRDGDQIVGFRGVLTDITARKRMEEALQKAREELEARVEHQMLRRNPYSLTFRELTLLHLVAAGESDKQIGTTLGISPLTAQKHISNILGKMRAASRTEAGVRAVREGLLD